MTERINNSVPQIVRQVPFHTSSILFHLKKHLQTVGEPKSTVFLLSNPLIDRLVCKSGTALCFQRALTSAGVRGVFLTVLTVNTVMASGICRIARRRGLFHISCNPFLVFLDIFCYGI